MLILMTFTIVFIVVYLYYIVRDMKRMYGDFKKQAAEVQTLQATVGEMKNTLQMALYGSVPPAAATIAVTTVHAESLPKHQPCSIDAESVESEDIRKLVADGDDEDGVAAADAEAAPADETAPADEATTPSKDEIVAMKLDQLKEVCKQYNLSIKGSRETLINRILTEKNIN